MPGTDKPPAAEPVVLGRVAGLYGVKGWVKVFSYTQPKEALLDYRDLLLRLEDRWAPASLAEGSLSGKNLVARFEGVADRDRAAALIGADIAVPRSSLPETEEGEYYWADLEGLRVRHKDGRVLGRVSHLLETGANDVLVVRPDEEAREILIPFVTGRYVLEVDLEQGVIEVDWAWD